MYQPNDVQMDTLKLKAFQAQLKALLGRAGNFGPVQQDLCEFAEHILINDWSE